MAVLKLFSKRQKALRKDSTDILTYDNIYGPLRVQIIHVIRDAFGESYSQFTDPAEAAFKEVHDILCREYGLFKLNTRNMFEEKVFDYILLEKDTERVIDAIELCFKYIDKVIRTDNAYKQTVQIKVNADNAIEELNDRFKEHAVGYIYAGGEIIKVDSTYIHKEVVKPTLNLLNNKRFFGANEEYLKAHEHYRHNRNKECLAECLKAFESTMKIICTVKKWSFNEKDTASVLIKVCFDNGLLPSYLQSQMSSLRASLESGIPTIRNRVGGHGQGASPTKADDETTRYMLNLTGSTIIYLIELSGI